MKRTFAIIMTFLMLFCFASCNNESTADEPLTEASYTQQTENETASAQNEKTEAPASDTATDSSSDPTETESESLTVNADPSEWTNEEIVAFYKAAAIRSKTKVKSTEYKNLKEMVVNDGDGLLGTLVEWATPFLVSALEDSQSEFEGITGGYKNLSASDISSAKAYKDGNYTVIEMTMKEQTDGIHADRYSGTVGHAISVLGDISAVEEALPMFSIDFENSDIRLRYTNPTVKVRINNDGIIEKGTWSYSIDITVKNLYVAAVRLPIEAMVESAYGTVDYVVTVGGGF